MSEYWKSTPKYWCKHCSLYVKDTPFERKQHEITGKHQGNLKRSLRSIQNDHERNERDKQKAKAEVERLNRLVGESSHGPASANTTTLSQSLSISKTKPAAPDTADRKRQWAQLSEMGIKVPEQYRSEVAMPGHWKTVSQRNITEDSASQPLNQGIRKRKLNEEEEEDRLQQEADKAGVPRRRWGTITKQYPGQSDDSLKHLFSATIKKHKDAEIVKLEAHDQVTAMATNSADDQVPEQATAKAELSESNMLYRPIKNDEEIGTFIVDASFQSRETDESKTAISESVSPEISAPVFKKRKAKSQPNR